MSMSEYAGEKPGKGKLRRKDFERSVLLLNKQSSYAEPQVGQPGERLSNQVTLQEESMSWQHWNTELRSFMLQDASPKTQGLLLRQS